LFLFHSPPQENRLFCPYPFANFCGIQIEGSTASSPPAPADRKRAPPQHSASQV
jgi:hypothetical protein